MTCCQYSCALAVGTTEDGGPLVELVSIVYVCVHVCLSAILPISVSVFQSNSVCFGLSGIRTNIRRPPTC